MIEFVSKYPSEIIATCAVFLTIYQATLQRHHNRLSVKPHITTFTHKDRTNNVARICGQVMNNGLGPAFIEKFEVFLDGAKIEPEEAYEALFSGLKGHTSYTNLGVNYAMPAGEARDLLVYTFPCMSDTELQNMFNYLDRLDLKIVYKCGYGKRKTYDSRKKTNKPTRTENAPEIN